MFVKIASLPQVNTECVNVHHGKTKASVELVRWVVFGNGDDVWSFTLQEEFGTDCCCINSFLIWNQHNNGGIWGVIGCVKVGRGTNKLTRCRSLFIHICCLHT